MRSTRDQTTLSPSARYSWVIAGTVACTLLGLTSQCRADFSSANFKRVWAEEFGHVGNSVGVPPSGGANGFCSGAEKPAEAGTPTAGTPTPHPAVARIVVPEGEATSFGSGTLIDVRDNFGIVVTNWHVVRDAQGPIDVIFPGGFTSKARALKMDADWDLAALVIWRPPVEPVKIALSAPQPGDQLTICGYGPGVYRSATGRCTQYYAPKENLPQQMVELDVEARQGDSGGPILNSRGELAGVLFGAGNGTTMGSYGGRVDQFLASLAPDIGGERGIQLAEARNNTDTPAEANEEATAEWRSSTPLPTDSKIRTASNTLLEPPAFEVLDEREETMPLGAASQPQATLATLPQNPQGIGQPPMFEKIKTGLAAFGLFSIAVMLLKAAG